MKVEITGFNKERKIPAIKAVRTLTGMGLKESKNIIDDTQDGNKHSIETNPEFDVRQIVNILDEGEVQYNIISNLVTHHLKETLQVALDKHNFELVCDLAAVAKKHGLE